MNLILQFILVLKFLSHFHFYIFHQNNQKIFLMFNLLLLLLIIIFKQLNNLNFKLFKLLFATSSKFLAYKITPNGHVIRQSNYFKPQIKLKTFLHSIKVLSN